MNYELPLAKMLAEYPVDDLKQAFFALNVAAPLSPKGARRTTTTYLAKEIAKHEAERPQRVVDVLISLGYELYSNDLPAELREVVELHDEPSAELLDGFESVFTTEQASMLSTTFNEYDAAMSRAVREASGAAIAAAETAVENMRPKADHFTVSAPRRKDVKVNGHPPAEFQRMLDLGALRKEIRLVGPTGCGKTTVCSMLAEALGLRFTALSLNEGASESHIRGRLLPMGKSGTFVYTHTDFVDFFENGGLVLLDEFDAADPNVLLVFNSALANGYMSLPERTDKPMAHRHKDFVCVVTCNTAGAGADQQYTARNALDEATLDRFRIGTIFMDYDIDVERAVVRDDVREWGWDMRRRTRAMKLARNVSTRFLCEVSEMAALGGVWASKAFWLELLTAEWSEDERKRLT